ncbi:MAG TPA: hypothetical protein VFO45_07325, partial [Sphingomicrobium sp.]|nr:hypothetical protein [Sphingomicrobium sp.]
MTIISGQSAQSRNLVAGWALADVSGPEAGVAAAGPPRLAINTQKHSDDVMPASFRRRGKDMLLLGRAPSGGQSRAVFDQMVLGLPNHFLKRHFRTSCMANRTFAVELA